MHGLIGRDDFLAKYVAPFVEVKWEYEPEGYIVWRHGTGGNVELLHIRTFRPGQGDGRRLVYRMLDLLRERPPYYSVFGFTRASNAEAQAFYGALGFNLQPVNGLYAEGQAVMFWQSYERLMALKGEYEDNLRRQA